MQKYLIEFSMLMGAIMKHRQQSVNIYLKDICVNTLYCICKHIYYGLCKYREITQLKLRKTILVKLISGSILLYKFDQR